MGIVGIYKASKFLIFNPGSPSKMGTAEEYLEVAKAHWGNMDEAERKHEEQQLNMLLGALVEIKEDGTMMSYCPIPEGVSQEMIDQAIESGEIQLAPIEGYMIVDEPKEWKEEDGVYKYDTRQHREIMGEILSSWDDLKFDGKTITLSDGMSIYEKTN